jgi:hypothetical protein
MWGMRSLIFGIVLATSMIGPSPSLAQSAQGRAAPLKNDDIVKMVQAGLDDTIIITKIKSSQCDFDTSTDALISLKKRGVSNAVLTAMAGAISPAASSTQSSTPSVPTEYGYYLLGDNGYALLAPSPVEIVTGLRQVMLNATFVVDGFSKDLAPIDIAIPSPTWLAYEQNIDVTALHLVKLDFVTSMQAQEFDIGQVANGGALDQFQNIYGVARTASIRVNLWGPQASEIQLRVEPVPERTGMFRLSPQSDLAPGRYALYYRNALHPNLIVNYKGSVDQDGVFYFKVSPTSASPGDTPAGTVQTLMSNGLEAFRSGEWQDALTDFQGAEKSDNTGLASLWVGNTYLAMGSFTEFGGAWDRALGFNHVIAVPVCHTRGIQQCETGTLEVGKTAVRFLIAGQSVFEGAPSSITPNGATQHNLAGYADFSLQVVGKKYDLIFVPYGVQCQVLAHVNCQGNGTQQQKAVGDYIEQTITKLSAPK